MRWRACDPGERPRRRSDGWATLALTLFVVVLIVAVPGYIEVVRVEPVRLLHADGRLVALPWGAVPFLALALPLLLGSVAAWRGWLRLVQLTSSAALVLALSAWVLVLAGGAPLG